MFFVTFQKRHFTVGYIKLQLDYVGHDNRNFIPTWEASRKEVSWFICSLGSTVLKNTEVMPDPQTADDRVNSMHRWFLMRGSSGGISMGKHGEA